MANHFNYIPTPTGLLFHESDAFVKGIVGPFGSGKSCAIVNDILFYCMAQPIAPNSEAPDAPKGVRYSKWGIIRAHYPELKTTTRPSIMEVFPSDFGTINQGGAPITGLYRFPIGDGSVCQVEFQLQALETEYDLEKIKSSNWTGVWINEATGVDFEVFSMITGRIGRYPPEDLGGCAYAGVLIDTNQPPRGHYLLDLIENPEPNWEWFRQPPAVFKHVDDAGVVSYTMNPEAENLTNLGAKKKPEDFNTWAEKDKYEFLIEKGLEYYSNQVAAHKKKNRLDIIDSLFCMLDVPMRDGKPVFSIFNINTHVSKEIITPVPYQTVLIGFDTSGIHPAAALLQENQGRWAIVDELYGDEVGLEVFIEQLLVPLLRDKYSNCPAVVSCDPANARDSYTSTAPTEHLKNAGLQVSTPKTNDPRTRIRVVEQLLNRTVGGLIVSKHCSLIIRGFQGGYRYRRVKVYGSIDEAYHPNPEKNMYSHIMDAVEYAGLYIVKGDFSHTQAENSKVIKRAQQRRQALRKIM